MTTKIKDNVQRGILENQYVPFYMKKGVCQLEVKRRGTHGYYCKEVV